MVFGHSFGGLLLEQTAFHIYNDAFAFGDPQILSTCKEDPQARGLKPFTDLILTINPAVHAVQGKKIVELFQTHQGDFCYSTHVNDALPRPLLVSFVSKGDFLSATKGTVARHALGHERETADPFRFTPGVNGQPPSRFAVEVATPARLLYFQNLCYLDSEKASENNTTCDLDQSMFGNEDAMVFSRVPKDRTGPGLADISKPEPQKPNSARAVPSTGSAVAPGATSAAEPETSSLAHSWNPLNHLYVRFDCRPATGAHPEDHREPCRTATPFENPDDTHVWNRTPYWISAIDTNVIRGHNDLWNARFAALLTGMAAQFDVLGPDDVLPEPSARRTSSTY